MLSAYMDGELQGVEHGQVRSHLNACERCTVEYEDLLSIKRALSMARPVAPRRELGDVIVNVIAGEAPAPRRRSFLPSLPMAEWLAVAGAAAGIMFVILWATGYGRRVDGTDRASQAAAVADQAPAAPGDLQFIHEPSGDSRPMGSAPHAIRIVPASAERR